MFGLKHEDVDSENITIKKSTYSRIIYGTIIAVAAATFFAGFQLGSSSETNSESLTKSDFEDAIDKLETKFDNVGVVAPAGLPSQPAGLPAELIAGLPSQPDSPSIFKVSIGGNPVKGDPNAPVTIVEFSDFECSFCKRFVDQTLKSIEDEYISTGKVKFVFRDLPLTSIHPNAMSAHIAAECADEQGKFWEYHDILFEKQAQWSKLNSEELKLEYKMYAILLGLNDGLFESCLSSQKIQVEIDSDLLHARINGITGTPAFFIGNEDDGFIKLSGARPFIIFKNEIDKQLG